MRSKASIPIGRSPESEAHSIPRSTSSRSYKELLERIRGIGARQKASHGNAADVLQALSVPRLPQQAKNRGIQLLFAGLIGDKMWRAGQKCSG